MNPDFMTAGTVGLGMIFGFVGIAVSVFWMVVGWRAMKAHEKLADAAEEMSRRTRS